MTDHDLVLVVDFGAQYAQLIARRVREAKVYSEIVPHTTPVAEILARKPAAIVLSGGPSSVYAPGAPGVDAALFDADVPVFGMCYGFQAMAQALGGEVARTGISEYGRTPVRVVDSGTLLADIPLEHRVWMSHGDSVRRAPEGFDVLATTAASPVAAFENTDRRFAGVQWHPEVLHTENGQKVFEHFLLQIAGCRPTWTMVNIVEEQIDSGCADGLSLAKKRRPCCTSRIGQIACGAVVAHADRACRMRTGILPRSDGRSSRGDPDVAELRQCAFVDGEDRCRRR